MSLVAQLFIPGRLPGSNELNAMQRRKGGYRQYTAVKSRWEGVIGLIVQSERIPRFEAAHLRFVLVEPNRRRDPPNAVEGAQKIILDGLTRSGVLPNDGWGQILSLSWKWRVDAAKPGVLVTLIGNK